MSVPAIAPAKSPTISQPSQPPGFRITLARTTPTSPGIVAITAPRARQPGSRSRRRSEAGLDLRAEAGVRRDQGVDVAEPLVAMLEELVRGHAQQRLQVPPDRRVQGP